MEKIEQEYVDSCWKLANSLDTYLLAEDDTSSIREYYLILKFVVIKIIKIN